MSPNVQHSIKEYEMPKKKLFDTFAHIFHLSWLFIFLMSLGVFWDECKTILKSLAVFSLHHFAVFLSWPLLYFQPRLLVPLFLFFLLFLPDCFSLLLWCSFFELLLLCLSCLLAFILFFFPPLPCSFSLSSSACLPPLALTGGYSSLGWAETASLYNTDRLLCNQIPSVATSEDSLSLSSSITHTRACM